MNSPQSILMAFAMSLLALQANGGSSETKNDAQSSARHSIESTNPKNSPRLLKISRGEFSAHILPENHLGTNLEQDPYFDEIIMKAAKSSSVIVGENAFIDMASDSTKITNSCLQDKSALATLGSALSKRIVRHHHLSYWSDFRRALYQQDPSTADSHFEIFLDGRGLMLNYWDAFFFIVDRLDSNLNPKRLAGSLGSLDNRPPILPPSKEIRQRLPHLGSESIESFEDISESMCSLADHEKAQAIQELIDAIDRAGRGEDTTVEPGFEERITSIYFSLMLVQLGAQAAQALPAFDRYLELQPDFKFRLNSSASKLLAATYGPTIDKMIIGGRNLLWAQRIKEHAGHARKGLFYILGAAHLVDYGHFDGLITLLKQRGFQVELVR